MIARLFSIVLLCSGCVAPSAPKAPWPSPSARSDAPTPRTPPPPLRRSAPPASRQPPPHCAPLDRRITLSVSEADLVAVLGFIADEAGLNLVVDSGVRGVVTVRLRGVTVGAALDALMQTEGLDATIDGCILSARAR